ncbi:MAG: Holliday junction resolvase RuvX [Planctomycetota bacterium]|nr:Holliday junction resolvase RuvX [Planctomycetota bacterium]
MGSIVGIDYGRKRIGLAIADTESRIATPLTTIAGRNDVTRDARIVSDASQAVEVYVVGLPMNMDGTDSEQTRLTRRFASELGRLSGRPVHFQDERLSTYAASELLSEAGLSRRRRKELTDRIAAQQILQAWLDPGVSE